MSLKNNLTYPKNKNHSIMKNQFLLVMGVLLFITPFFAQEFNLSGELIPRYENRNGFGSLRTEGDGAGGFISQRTRINFNFKNTKMRFKVAIQNVRVWGDVATMAFDDNAISFHEAWAEAIISEKLSMKFGRQEIVYDDHRIFGNVDWAQQARSHDAFLLKITPNKNHRIDLGFAYNSDTQENIDNLYSNAAGYKTFQYGWYHGKFNKIELSFLTLNTGIEYLKYQGTVNEEQTIDFMQTIGPRITFKNQKINADAALYLQKGKSINRNVNALYFGGSFGYEITDRVSAGLGGEYLSGTDMNATNNDVNSFAPLFGTNHKFNGWMDYFYVGNHANNVGLTDIYLTFSFKKDKFFMKLVPHYFASAAQIVDTNGNKMDNYLGTEIDYVMGYKLTDSIKVKAGYSQMFATESMEILKGGNSDITNNWTWLMVTFKPTFFIHKTSKITNN